MKFISRFLAVSLGSVLVCGGAVAAEIKVLSAGAIKSVIVAALPEFEKRTGHKVTIDNDTAGALLKRVRSGERFDLLVMPPGGLRELAAEGAVTAAQVPIAKVGIGVAVKSGAPRPDISTTAAFREALLSARKVAYIDPAAGGSSGIYLSKLFESWGIAPQIQAKAVLVPGGLVATRLVTGEADLAIHQISEIITVQGATLIGPIPAEIQNYTVYAASAATATRESEAVGQLLATLASPQVREQLVKQGMEAP